MKENNIALEYLFFILLTTQHKKNEKIKTAGIIFHVAQTNGISVNV
jgi:hypothetical protein